MYRLREGGRVVKDILIVTRKNTGSKIYKNPSRRVGFIELNYCVQLLSANLINYMKSSLMKTFVTNQHPNNCTYLVFIVDTVS